VSQSGFTIGINHYVYDDEAGRVIGEYGGQLIERRLV
jgi:hypothetical protein